MITSQEELSALIGDIYDCALDPSLWTVTLESISRRLGAEYVSVSMLPTAPKIPPLVFCSPWKTDALTELYRKFLPDIPIIDEFVQSPLDTPVATLTVMPEEQAHDSLFFRDWGLPNGLRDGCLTKCVMTSGAIGTLSLLTGLTRDPVSTEEQELMRLLAPHVRRSLMIGDTVTRANAAADRFRTMLDTLSDPVILLSGVGRLLYANPSADTVLKEGQLLAARQGEVRAVDPVSAQAFADSVKRAIVSDDALGRRGIGLPLKAHDGTPFFVYILPLGQSDVRSLQSASAAVFITSSDRHRPAMTAILMTLFDLTPAEARLAIMLYQGLSITEAAGKLRVATSTARTHLANIFSKTNTHRQADVVSLVANCSLPVSAVM